MSYAQHQLQLVFDTAVTGNGLLSLAHQLEAAKLNIANGASSAGIASTVAAADALIGDRVSPPIGSGFLDPLATIALTNSLDAFNQGLSGVPHCP